ncbi:MAG TPA: hypothetical protein ENI39_08165, partial [Anaerolineae bacterium]|nr:hypothetical protein [Anaerolineae bacterium]
MLGLKNGSRKCASMQVVGGRRRQVMKKTVLRVVTVLALLVLAVGCGDGAGTEILDEPVSLPPTRVPATVASVVRPTPVSTPILPTTTASPTAGVGPALEPS